MDIRTGTTPVGFGPHTVDVPAGGYYDRFRMNPDLDEVARDPTAGNVDFFRRTPKRIVESSLGAIRAPNFYYRSGSVQLLFVAPPVALSASDPIVSPRNHR
ncbi:hypothetical protein LGN04_27715 [Burkholderia multivorans]|uniref:Uncharacterized protein n=1 Tax=Burkholderia multivorans TaxID=87883 RepID=A0AAP2HQB3_9BURK|nr:hypothetical protein [Burkholderia multivorans]MBU9360638.1 hypothetical protein [Burkholderia multivorans]MBU9597831.1 hypothetical protein [Burkholderia multivorans]MCA8457693.1 hypothetical protein [Burkholderia multivorans]MCA8483744.1 hypothetical protein [Burkholderia multivorans]MDN7871629.1 hypothetical protein [Burkholderia multivorans]